MTRRTMTRRTMKRSWIMAATLGLVAATAGPAMAAQTHGGPEQGDLVTTASGPVRGVVGGTTRVFSGIPYAAPPVGPLRWQPPRPAASWSQPRDASKPGPVCRQMPYNMPVGSTMSEDCLTLNVTTPRTASVRHPKPVVVFVHGGDFTTGSGSQFEPDRMAAQGDVVVITINYRLGIYGFFGYPGLNGSGTFGLQDQQAALRWVRANARAFGGDPGNVTLAGQSAGAVSVCGQLTAPGAAGLFDKAVIQSAGCGSYAPTLYPGPGQSVGQKAVSMWRPVGEVIAQGAATATALGCAAGPGQLDCLRTFDPDKLIPALNAFSRPAYGTPTLPLDPAAAIRAGKFARVPVLTGHTSDEGRMVTAGLVNPAAGGTPMTEERYTALTDAAYGDRAAEVRRLYPVAEYAAEGGDFAAALAWAAIETDRNSACPVLRDAEAFARKVPVSVYEFADRNAPTWTPFPAGFPAGASHISDLMYLFDADRPGGTPVQLTADQRRLAADMITYWTAFAHHGDPGSAGTVNWPRYTPAAQRVQSLTTERIRPETNDAAKHHCAFWKTMS